MQKIAVILKESLLTLNNSDVKLISNTDVIFSEGRSKIKVILSVWSLTLFVCCGLNSSLNLAHSEANKIRNAISSIFGVLLLIFKYIFFAMKVIWLSYPRPLHYKCQVKNLAGARKRSYTKK